MAAGETAPFALVKTVQRAAWSIGRNGDKCVGVGDVEISDMNTRIDVNRISGKVKTRNLVLKKGAVGAEMDPSIMRDAVARLNTARRIRKIEWPVDIGVAMGKIDPAAKRGEIMARRVIP